MLNNNINQMSQFVSMIKGNKNPQEYVMGMLKERAGDNPVYSNLMSMINSGDTRGVESVVRNIAKEKGVDFDKEFNSFKQMFRL